jgi:hypothetical protein
MENCEKIFYKSIFVFKKIMYHTRAWLLGWQGTPWRMFSLSSHEKCIFYFRSAKIEFFVRQLFKRYIENNIQHK